MKYFVLVFISCLLFSCSENNETQPNFAKDYGRGLYIATDNGISFYDGDTLINNAFRNVNGITLSNVNKIKFSSNKIYILSDNQLNVANVNTLENLGEVSYFNKATDLEFVSPGNRVFVVDNGDSKVKLVDLDRLDIISDIETGENTFPTSVIKRYYRTIVMNGGGGTELTKDSTIVVIDHSDDLIPLADLAGSLYVGDNPNSAVNINDLKILCQGIYDPNNTSSNTFSSLVKVNPWDIEVVSTQTLNNIYGARNLRSNSAGSYYFFTASDGVYSMNQNGTSVSKLTNVVSDVLFVQNEQYPTSDTTFSSSNMLYINDSDNSPSTLYKYNISTSSFTDTIDVNGIIRDINSY